MNNSVNEFPFERKLEMASIVLLVLFLVFFAITMAEVLNVVRSEAYSNVVASINFH